MKKKFFTSPFIIASQVQPGVQPSPGLGSAQTTVDILPWDYETWCVLYDEYDPNGNGVPCEWDEYVQWMTANGFEDLIDESEKP